MNAAVTGCVRSIPVAGSISLPIEKSGQFLEGSEEGSLRRGRANPQDVGVFGRADVAMNIDGMAADDDERHAVPGEHLEQTEVRRHRVARPRVA